MPRYRVTIRKTTITDTVVEVDADSVAGASERGQSFADDVRGARRGITIISSDDDEGVFTSQRRTVIAVKEA